MEIILSQKQLNRKNLIIQCIDKKLSTKQAAIKAGLNIRTIQYNIKRFNEIGDKCFVHGNLGKKRNNEELENEKRKIINIFLNTLVNDKNPFENISYSFFTVILKDYYAINKSRTFIKKLLNSIGYKSPNKHKCKKTSSLHLMRERKSHFGELVQADGTPYEWFMTSKKYCIQGFIDDATGYPVGLYMTKNEALLGYTEAFRNMAFNHGIPEQIYPDKAGIFFVNQKTKDDKTHLTQFGLMMENLGVDMFPAHSPQAKGRIERFWQTIQQRLPPLFALRGIDTIEKANDFLRDEFPNIYQKWFPVNPSSTESKFVKADMKEVNNILKATFPGTVDKGGIFTLKGYRFFTKELANTKILIHLNEKEGLWITKLNDTKKYVPVLVETDTTGSMPQVMQDLIERVFLKNAKPKFREVYFDVDDIVLEELKPKKVACQ